MPTAAVTTTASKLNAVPQSEGNEQSSLAENVLYG